MYPRDYRAEYAEEIADEESKRGATDSAPRGARELVRIIRDRDAVVSDRLAALREATWLDPLRWPSAIKAMFGVLRNVDEPAELRLAALTTLQQASLRMVEFRRYQADFTGVLRELMTSADERLRDQALDILALDNDPQAQEMLSSGLREPGRASVAPVQALRMLGYDVHGDYYPLLHEIVDTSDDPGLRRMSLELLSADPRAKDVFARIAANPNEDPVARRTSVAALQLVAPEEFGQVARAIVNDDTDDETVRASALSALTHDPAEPDRSTWELAGKIDRSARSSAQLKSAARDYLAQAEPME